MSDLATPQLIEGLSVEDELDDFRVLFNSACRRLGLSSANKPIDQLEPKDLRPSAFVLLDALARLLPETARTLKDNLETLRSSIASDDHVLDSIKPLIKAALADKPDNALIWDLVSRATVNVRESTPPRQAAPVFQQTPFRYSTGSVVNSSEFHGDIDLLLKRELGPFHPNILDFHKAFFGSIPDLETLSSAVFQKCQEGPNPLFHNGWEGWPDPPKEDPVLKWFTDIATRLVAIANDCGSSRACRQPLIRAQPDKPLPGSVAKRKLDIGFLSDVNAGVDSIQDWSQILIPGELKGNPSADTPSKAWTDIATYAREVLARQDSRRFVLAFTICGPLMRLWEFDRLGALASDSFDLNKDGERFVSTILGFLLMSQVELGFDPTIISSGAERYINIERNNCTERLIIDGVIRHSRCIAGRATTCWKAYNENSPGVPLVIKDSWQDVEREEEGEMLQQAIRNSSVVNVARYYHHETVLVGGRIDDVLGNVRKELRVPRNDQQSQGIPDSSSRGAHYPLRQHLGSRAGAKRKFSQTDAALPPSKRSQSASQSTVQNREHRRVILRDYGKPIHEASSHVALLAAFESCIEGHESLRKSGFLHRDISINNILINEDKDNPSFPAFLIDLDLAIREQQEKRSGAMGKIGTRAFMAIGLLKGQQHSFMHDLESFFWVLFWICIHYDGPGKDIGPTNYESWNYESDDTLLQRKSGVVSVSDDFQELTEETFTPYYQSLGPVVCQLRQVVFPDGKRWVKENPALYSRMRQILTEAQKDPRVADMEEKSSYTKETSDTEGN